MPNYVINEGSIHHRFWMSRAKIQIFAGSYANGKTAAMCVKGLHVADTYPGANILVARETYVKLNDSTRKEMYKWMPKDWVRRWPNKDENSAYLHSGTVINFRYAKQQGAGKEHKTSNLLSNTYDLIIVDQMEDPGFTRKDLPDLIGRLRGSAEYIGDDPTMPRTGPRWLLIGCNPTAGWIYKDYIRHYLEYKESGKVSSTLQRMLDDFECEKVEEFIEVINGSTMDNAHNLGEDVIRAMKATYTGVMRERFLMGSWNVLEGLVYPQYKDEIHLVNKGQVMKWISEARPKVHLEGIDHGIAKPTCYGLALRDDRMNTVVVDGFYEAELTIDDINKKIKEIRHKWGIPDSLANGVYADPAMFRRVPTKTSDQAGESVKTLLWDDGKGINLSKGNNDVMSGIIKVRSYLEPRPEHINPFTGEANAPYLYFLAENTEPWQNEIVDYYFDEDKDGERDDKPIKRNDHAMDQLKYMLTDAPSIAEITKKPTYDMSYLTKWNEGGYLDVKRNPRYG